MHSTSVLKEGNIEGLGQNTFSTGESKIKDPIRHNLLLIDKELLIYLSILNEHFGTFGFNKPPTPFPLF